MLGAGHFHTMCMLQFIVKGNGQLSHEVQQHSKNLSRSTRQISQHEHKRRSTWHGCCLAPGLTWYGVWSIVPPLTWSECLLVSQLTVWMPPCTRSNLAWMPPSIQTALVSLPRGERPIFMTRIFLFSTELQDTQM